MPFGFCSRVVDIVSCCGTLSIMKSSLSGEGLYVLCLGCAVAQLVESREEGLKIMKGHETAQPEHRTHQRVVYGKVANKVVANQKDDDREVTSGRLEVR